jgi:hypothetical protein
MGWGHEPHEGHGDRRLADGTLTAAWTTPSAESTAPSAEFVAYVAVCSCGWRGTDSHEPTEDGYEAAGQEWDAKHWQPLVTPELDQVLVARRDGGGLRHYLAGEAVHCGAALELLVAGGQWMPVRYETSLGEPVAYQALGGPAERFGANEVVHFDLPSEAILRWPT